MFYSGLRKLLGLSERASLTVTQLPIAAVLILALPYILAPLH
jgi:hypothetical protein